MEAHSNGGSQVVTDFLQFDGGVVGSKRYGWTGEWPPPARMGIAVGNQSGVASVFDPDSLEAGVTLDDVEAVARVTMYRRVSASTLPGDMDNSHVLRGARYVPE